MPMLAGYPYPEGDQNWIDVTRQQDYQVQLRQYYTQLNLNNYIEL